MFFSCTKCGPSPAPPAQSASLTFVGMHVPVYDGWHPAAAAVVLVVGAGRAVVAGEAATEVTAVVAGTTAVVGGIVVVGRTIVVVGRAVVVVTAAEVVVVVGAAVLVVVGAAVVEVVGAAVVSGGLVTSGIRSTVVGEGSSCACSVGGGPAALAPTAVSVTTVTPATNAWVALDRPRNRCHGPRTTGAAVEATIVVAS